MQRTKEQWSEVFGLMNPREAASFIYDDLAGLRSIDVESLANALEAWADPTVPPGVEAVLQQAGV